MFKCDVVKYDEFEFQREFPSHIHQNELRADEESGYKDKSSGIPGAVYPVSFTPLFNEIWFILQYKLWPYRYYN